MEVSTIAVSSCSFGPPVFGLAVSAPRTCCGRSPRSVLRRTAGNALERRARPGCKSFNNTGGKIMVGAVAGSLFGQQLGVRLGSGARWTASTWLDNSARVEADVPLSEAWALWSDQENVVNWMPWIAEVKVLKDQPNMSKWTLRYEAFGQNLEFSWLARLLKPIQNQKIHWRSVDGLANRGAVRFYPRGPTSCGVELTISYEVPDVLAPFASGVKPLVESILQGDLNRFAVYAKSQSAKKNATPK
ncbi:uncharacterized protein [Physcomitrium patens]|nr:uncharacterized protein LOC112278177 [Physcomitrium patens]PNR26891.1 hypothetical protein PHYPA_030372 [Physcomitrium patens]|eukprot:XP_024367120.1 uncharacterized protein LOC112278177 [Physcomitrella patens]